jgi:hypothetical protein
VNHIDKVRDAGFERLKNFVLGCAQPRLPFTDDGLAADRKMFQV